MLIEKPMLGILDRVSFLNLIDLLWGKADCFSLTSSREIWEELPIEPNQIRKENNGICFVPNPKTNEMEQILKEDNTVYYELNPKTKAFLTIRTGFLDFSDGSWCDLKFYRKGQIILEVITHESSIEIDAQLYREFLKVCEREYARDNTANKVILLYDEMETSGLSDSIFSWKRNDDGSSIRIEIEKSGKRYIADYRFPMEFETDIPERKQVVAKEIEFGSQAGVRYGSRNTSVFALSVVTDPPKLFKYKTTEVEETSLSLTSLEVFMI